MKKVIDFVTKTLVSYFAVFILLGVIQWAGIFVTPTQAIVLFIGSVLLQAHKAYNKEKEDNTL